MDMAAPNLWNIHSIEDRQLEIETQWDKLLKEKREVEARAHSLDQMERQFNLKWSILVEETQRLAKDKEAFERKQEFFNRVIAFEKKEEQKNHASEDNIIHGELFFSGVTTEKALKKRYKDLIKIYHPDSESGDNETVQEINREYDNLKGLLP